MPTYEYVCEACGHDFDVFQSMKDDKLKQCPKCKAMKLKRKIGGGAGIIFHGKGFTAPISRIPRPPPRNNLNFSA